jgi:hypothetical protein
MDGSIAYIVAAGMILVLACGCVHQQSGTVPAEVVIPRYGVIDISLFSRESLPNPFWDATARACFSSPSGKTIEVEGFYYGEGEWRVRFVPREEGRWTYQATLMAGRTLDAKRGEFACRGSAGHGFIRVSKINPYRWEYEDGTPFYPIGIQTCSFLKPDFDGPDETGKWRSTTTENWLSEFRGAVNLVRTQFGQGTTDGCAVPLIPAPPKAVAGAATKPAAAVAPDRYDLELACKVDDTYRLHRAAGMSQILICFQDMSLFGDPKHAFGAGHDLKGNKSVAAANMPLQEKYLRYLVARYGAFVDVWELYNEDTWSPDDYLAHLAGVIRKADPYGHIVTTNLARPRAAWNDIITWHEYMGMPAEQVDAHLAGQAALWKSYGKLVQNTEFGNQGGLSNVDPVKWRIAVWTSYMNECHLLFWGMSGRKVEAGAIKSGNANAYIGPDSRQHFRVLHNFTSDMPLDMRPVFSGFTRHNAIRHWALSNGKVTALYIHHFADHAKEYVSDSPFWVDTGPGQFRVHWINPGNGEEVATDAVSTQSQYLEIRIPTFKVDLAARIDRIGP